MMTPERCATRLPQASDRFFSFADPVSAKWLAPCPGAFGKTPQVLALQTMPHEKLQALGMTECCERCPRRKRLRMPLPAVGERLFRASRGCMIDVV